MKIRFLIPSFIIVLALLICSQQAISQDFISAKIILVDGKELKGQANEISRVLDPSITFRANEKSEKVKYESEKIRTIIYYYDKEGVEFDWMRTYPLIGKKLTQPGWLQVLKRGYATLYYTVRAGATLVRYGTKEPDDQYWLCKRPHEEGASVISWVAGGNPNDTFKRKAPKYFIDYPELVEKINSKVYRYKDVNTVVKEYNDWIASKK